MNANKILLAVLILLIILTWILPPFTTKIKHSNSGIGEKVFLDIGGIKQGMIIKGNDMEKPVLLFLSGGPGIPDFFRGRIYCLLPRLAWHRIVLWEICHTGKNR